MVNRVIPLNSIIRASTQKMQINFRIIIKSNLNKKTLKKLILKKGKTSNDRKII